MSLSRDELDILNAYRAMRDGDGGGSIPASSSFVGGGGSSQGMGMVIGCSCGNRCLTSACPCRSGGGNCTRNCGCQKTACQNRVMTLAHCQCSGNCETNRCDCRSGGKKCVASCRCQRKCSNAWGKGKSKKR